MFAHMLDAAEMAVMPGWLSLVIQLGSFGLIAYLIVYGLPTLQREMIGWLKNIDIQRQAERESFERVLDEQRKTCNEEHAQIRHFYVTEMEAQRKLYMDAITVLSALEKQCRQDPGCNQR